MPEKAKANIYKNPVRPEDKPMKLEVHVSRKVSRKQSRKQSKHSSTNKLMNLNFNLSKQNSNVLILNANKPKQPQVDLKELKNLNQLRLIINNKCSQAKMNFTPAVRELETV